MEVAMVLAVLKSRYGRIQRSSRMWYLQDLESAVIWSEKVRCSSEIKPRLRAEWVVVREQSCILQSCCLSPIRRNSVLEELRVRRLAVIQEEICCRAFCKWLMLECKSDGRKERKSCVSSAYRWWFKERDETKVLSVVVYMTKSRGPRTEPWGTPQRQVCGEEKSLLHLTRKQREKR